MISERSPAAFNSILKCLRNPDPQIPGYRIGVISIGGCRFHVEAVEVRDDEHHGQEAANQEFQDLLDGIDGENAFLTVGIPGVPGEWVLVITPHRI